VWHISFDDGEGPPGPPPWSPPDNELPVAVPIGRPVIRTGDLAVALTHALVYSTGWSLSGVGRLRPTAGRSFFDGGYRGRDGVALGVEYSDGRVGASVVARPPQRPSPGEVNVFDAGGGGSPHEREYSWWLTPLPTPGRLTVVVGGGDLGPQEAVVELDATGIAAAAADVVELWPWEPEPAPEPEAPLDDLMPADGWFRRFLDGREGRQPRS
jgi:hypothetical protein